MYYTGETLKLKSKLSLKILYVDDDEHVLKTIKHMLESEYHSTFFAKNGKEGFEMYNKYSPDIIICDIRMPVMDGIEMIKRIRKIDTTTPILIVSAFERELLHIDEIDIQGYIIKPITKFLLYSMIDSVVNE